jgi:hypothetical protein
MKNFLQYKTRVVLQHMYYFLSVYVYSITSARFSGFGIY